MRGRSLKKLTHFDESDSFDRPFGHELADKTLDVPSFAATEFEKARGVNKIETRGGFAGVQVGKLGSDLAAGRLGVLEAIREVGVSIDFLKLTSDGLSFLTETRTVTDVKSALKEFSEDVEIWEDRQILIVHAVNMRDEEGLVARIVSDVIASGAQIDHMGDMHDRLLMAMSAEDAEKAETYLRARFLEGGE